MAQQRKVALITGASRSVGKSAALALAKRGMDIVVASRTLTGTEAFDVSATAREKDVVAMPGSLQQTAAECRALGVRALAVKLDLLNRQDCENAVSQAMKEFGRVDVLVNNARYYGPGQQDLFEETEMKYIDMAMEANVLAPLYLTQLCLPSMKKNAGGVVVNLISGAGSREVAALPGKGGWGLNYSITKAAIARATRGLAKEFKQYNIAVVNVDPGNVVNEHRVHEAGKWGYTASLDNGLPPEVPGETIAYIATHPHPMFFSGKDYVALDVCLAYQLVDANAVAKNEAMALWGLPRN